MAKGLAPYPSISDSKIDWLGTIPSHWRLVPASSVLIERGEKNKGMIEKTVLSLSYGRVIVKPADKLHGLVPESFETYQIVNPSNIIIRPTDLQNDKTSLRVGLAKDRGIITSAYLCLKSGNDILPEYAYQLLHSYDVMKIFYGLGSGLRQNLGFKDIKKLPVALPPLDEQQKIVNFIQQQDRRIRRFIHANQKLLKLLEAQKQAVIDRIVSRGIDDNVHLKPSGVEWMGSVPSHWRVLELRRLATKFGSGVTPRGGATVYQESGIPFLRSQNIHFDGLRLESVARIATELHAHLSSTHIKPADVLLNITGASIGRVCSVPPDFTEGNVSQHVCIIRPRANIISSEFLAAFLSTPSVQREIRIEQNGASREGLTLHSTRRLKIAVPPMLEQRNILANILEQTKHIASMITIKNKEIMLICEYRSRLTADAVTGKIDLRSIPLELTEEPNEQDLTDISTNGFDTDIDPESADEELLEEAAHAN